MDSITSSLNEYSSTVSEYTVKIMNALLPVASIIILIFFLIELFRWNERLGQEGGSLTIRLWLEISIGYVISFILIHNIAHMFDGVVFLFNRAFVLVDRVLPQTQFNTTVDVSGVDGWIMQQLVSFVGGIANFVANVVSNLLVFMRFFQMYLLKAISPLIIAFFMSAQTRPISINFFKHFSAYAFQGVLLVIIMKLYPALVSDDLFKAAGGDGITAFASIAKSIVYITALFGSQRLAKSILNVT